MTDSDFELRLHAALRELAEPAPAGLRASVNAIPDQAATWESRGRRTSWGRPAVLGFAALGLAAVAVVVVVLVAVGSLLRPPVVAPPTGPGSPTVSPSVICEAFANGGPVEAVGAAFMAARRGDDWMGPARDGITGLLALAERVSGDEREDLLVFARDVAAGSRGVVLYEQSGAVDAAHGAAFDMYLAWDTFLEKYGPGCGLNLGI